ncbi:MAG: fibronectin type III domain-containing protein [Paludibacteraceae bacterium]|nr:fibronectin type III domain-containing protein [Paludibacteraceae bacterium]MBN2787694.1 fibronectin type III domain-containing protein [Paludibacteraceae bacterium]
MKRVYLLGIISLFMLINPLTARERVISMQVNKASDDIEEWLTGVDAGQTDYNSSDLELGCENKDGSNQQMVGVRFNNIPIGKSRTITNAYLEFELDATSKTTDLFTVYILAENSDSTATFNGSTSEPFALTSRPKLNDSILWSIPTGEFSTSNERYSSSDIKSLIQNLVNRTNWKTGNAMTFFIKGTGTREVESFEGEATAAAKLYIEYTMTEDDLTQYIADSIAACEEMKLTAQLDSVIAEFASRVTESDYTIPSWTLYKREEIKYLNNRILGDSAILINAQTALVNKKMPYTVSMAINGDPKTQLGFTWYTNLGELPGRVEILQGAVADTTAFQSATLVFNADTLGIRNLNYTVSNNNLTTLAGITANSKRNYTSHKTLATGLTANTLYSYRVGYPGAWSPVGTFTTATTGNDFRFLYLADTQAHNDEYFGVSQKTIAEAKNLMTNIDFCMMTGDLVETPGSTNSEWEWEQWFETNKAVWKDVPIAPICGNHDKSSNKNLTNHFNTKAVNFDQEMSTTPGSVYSFVYGDALFIACSTEDYSKVGYLDSLKNFIRTEVAAHPNVRWKIAFYHKTIYTGSNSHQSDSDGKTVRKALAPIFDEVGIDMAFQGHDHIYEVIGVTNNFALVNDANRGVQTVTGGVRENMTGKQGGIFNVKNGTLFFLNNSAGKKKYEPRDSTQMAAAFNAHQITNYWGMFTGKFGQTGEPTFSDVRVTADTIYVTTYTVNDAGIPTEFDSFKVVKTDFPTVNIKGNENLVDIRIYPNPSKNSINVDGIKADVIGLFNMNGQLVASSQNSNQINVSNLNTGVYLIKILSNDKMFVDQVIVKK